MAKNKTDFTTIDASIFLETLENKQQQSDSIRLMQLMHEVTGEQARMYGPNIIGFGKYHYRYDSGHEGEAPLLGFSPRKAAISLYVFTGAEEHIHLLDRLGKFKAAKACIYIKKLADINEQVLHTLMEETVKFLTEKYSRIKN